MMKLTVWNFVAMKPQDAVLTFKENQLVLIAQELIQIILILMIVSQKMREDLLLNSKMQREIYKMSVKAMKFAIQMIQRNVFVVMMMEDVVYL